MSDRDEDMGRETGDVEVKVTDRRKFDREGKPRAEVPEAADPSTEEEPAPSREATGEREAASRSPRQGEKATGSRAGRSAAAGKTGEGAGQVDFQSFVYFLYMSALHELGIPTQPGAEPRAADLERARFFVEVLQLLEVKTKGNLDPGETKLLEEALYNLRMQYVGLSQKADG